MQIWYNEFNNKPSREKKDQFSSQIYSYFFLFRNFFSLTLIVLLTTTINCSGFFFVMPKKKLEPFLYN
jgi:hypothetical protein